MSADGVTGKAPTTRSQRLRRRQVVRYRTDAAQALHHHRYFPVGPAFDELLEAAELDDVQPHLLHMVLRIEQDRHLAMAFDARDGVDGNAAQALRPAAVGSLEAMKSWFSRSGSGRDPDAACAQPSGR